MLLPTVSCVLFLLTFLPSAKPQTNEELGRQCTLSDGSTGTCKMLKDCHTVLENVTRGIYDHERCGFDQFLEIVCCSRKSARTKQLRPGERSSAGCPTREGFDMCGRDENYCEKYGALRCKIPIKCQKLRSERESINFYILGGEAATPGEFPHMAALGYQQKGKQSLSWQCGGTLISSQYVLTAAHCVEAVSGLGVPRVVRLGYTNIETDSETGQDYLIDKIIVHPKFKNNANYYDIALLRLEGKVEFSQWIYPACLYNRQEDPYTSLVVTGWGDTSGSGISPSAQLMKANLELVPLAACSREYKADSRTPRGVDPAMLCAGSSQTIDTCTGDSGGPLQLMEDPSGHIYSVVGVTSFGPSPCGGKKPGVYSRVASYLPWIENIVWN